MKRLICTTMSAVMLSTSLAFADPTIPPAPPLQPGEVSVGEAISPMKKGQVSPFTGVLLSPEAVAKIIVEFNNRDEQTTIEVNKAVAEQHAKDQFEIDELNADLIQQKSVADAQTESLNRQLKALNEQLAAAEKVKNDTPLYVGLGALGGAVVTVLAVVGVSLARK